MRTASNFFLLLGGILAAEIGSERLTMKDGDMVIIPAGVKHKFTNPGTTVAVTFNTYCPPEYPPNEKGYALFWSFAFAFGGSWRELRLLRFCFVSDSRDPALQFERVQPSGCTAS